MRTVGLAEALVLAVSTADADAVSLETTTVGGGAALATAVTATALAFTVALAATLEDAALGPVDRTVNTYKSAPPTPSTPAKTTAKIAAVFRRGGSNAETVIGPAVPAPTDIEPVDAFMEGCEPLPKLGWLAALGWLWKPGWLWEPG